MEKGGTAEPAAVARADGSVVTRRPACASGVREMTGTPGPGSPVATTCLNDAMNEHVGQSVAKTGTGPRRQSMAGTN